MPSLCWLPRVQRNGGPEGKLGFQATCGDQGFLSFPGAPQRTSHEGSVSYHTPSWLLPQLRNSGSRDGFSAVYKARGLGVFPIHRGYGATPMSLLRLPQRPLAAAALRAGEGTLAWKGHEGLFLACSDLETDLVCEARG